MAPGTTTRPSGAQASGWVHDGFSWYYLDPATGAMATGWVKDGDTWYYLNPTTGKMMTGWLKDGGAWYYLKTGSGAMATGRLRIFWTWYTFSEMQLISAEITSEPAPGPRTQRDAGFAGLASVKGMR